MTSKEQLKSAIDLVKGVINKTEPPALQHGSTTGPQCSIEIMSKNFPIHFEDAVNVLRSLQQDTPSTDARLSQGDVEKIVQRALIASARRSHSSKSNTEKKRQDTRSLFSETLAGIEALCSPIAERVRTKTNGRIFSGTSDPRSTTVVTSPAKTPLT